MRPALFGRSGALHSPLDQHCVDKIARLFISFIVLGDVLIGNIPGDEKSCFYPLFRRYRRKFLYRGLITQRVLC